MMQTGRLFTGGVEHPHAGCVLGYVKGARGEMPPHVLLPKPIGRTGGNLPHGQNAGYLGRPHDPFVLNADPAVPNFQVPDLLPPRTSRPSVPIVGNGCATPSMERCNRSRTTRSRGSSTAASSLLIA